MRMIVEAEDKSFAASNDVRSVLSGLCKQHFRDIGIKLSQRVSSIKEILKKYSVGKQL